MKTCVPIYRDDLELTAQIEITEEGVNPLAEIVDGEGEGKVILLTLEETEFYETHH